MKTTITSVNNGVLVSVRCLLFVLITLLAGIVNGQDLFGPENPPPKDASITYTGTLNDGEIGRSGGKTFTITNVILANTTTVYWTILEGSVRLSLDGDTYETEEILTVNETETNLSNGLLVWTGNTQIPISNADGTGIDHYDALLSKFIVTVTDQNDNALNLLSPSVTGLDKESGGAALFQANTDIVKARMEMFVSIDGTTWTPHLDYYDSEDTPPVAESAYSELDFGFYWENDPPELILNTGANVDENDTVRITSLMLSASDVESPDHEINIVFDLVGDQNLPAHGKLTLNEDDIFAGDTVTLFELVDDTLYYIHDGSETELDSLAFSIIDGDSAKCYVNGDSVFFFRITITPIDDPPTVEVNTGGEVTEDSVLMITNELLLGSDPESGAENLIFTVDPESNSVYPDHGLLLLNGVPLDDGSTFTQQDINDELVTYDHDGTETTTDGFVFSLEDEYGHLAEHNQSSLFFFNISINNTNDDPVITKLQTLTIDEGATGIISNLYIAATDEESPANEIQFVVDPEMNFPGPEHGTVLLDGVEIPDGESFSMENVNNSLVSYAHDGGEGRTDFFIFRVIDNDGGVAHDGEYTDFHFNISIENVNDPPVVENAIDDQIAIIGQMFELTFPENTFEDPDEMDELTYSAHSYEEPELPSWLNFDDAMRKFSGTPQASDEGVLTVILTAKDLDLAEAKDTFDITVSVSSNISIYKYPQIRIYPNPGNGIYTIEMENSYLLSTEICVLNILGKVVFEQTEIKSNKLILNLSDQPTGLYLVKIKYASKELCTKIYNK